MAAGPPCCSAPNWTHCPSEKTPAWTTRAPRPPKRPTATRCRWTTPAATTRTWPACSAWQSSWPATPAMKRTLTPLFQPAEETGDGAQGMVDDGLLKRIPAPTWHYLSVCCLASPGPSAIEARIRSLLSDGEATVRATPELTAQEAQVARWPARACPTPRSARGCSSARARCSTTWARSSPSSASPPQPARPGPARRPGCHSLARISALNNSPSIGVRFRPGLAASHPG